MERDPEGLMRAYSDPRLGQARACPYCGGRKLGIFPGPKAGMFRRKNMRVACANCHAMGPVSIEVNLAIAAWNGEYKGNVRKIERTT